MQHAINKTQGNRKKEIETKHYTLQMNIGVQMGFPHVCNAYTTSHTIHTSSKFCHLVPTLLSCFKFFWGF